MKSPDLGQMSALYGRILTPFRIHPTISGMPTLGKEIFRAFPRLALFLRAKLALVIRSTLLETVARRLLLDELSGSEGGEEEFFW
jgi:hypothetical protein